MNFQPGDVVVLKSGGPLMTIQDISGLQARCVWFDAAAKQVSNFHLSNLTKAETS